MNKKDIQFEWYVLNTINNSANNTFKDYPYSHMKYVKPFNIFSNYKVNEKTNELCKEYKKENMTLEEFIEKLELIIRCEEWSRCEYEISVGSLFMDKDEKPDKYDCYMQVLPNIEILAKYILNTYYPKLNIK